MDRHRIVTHRIEMQSRSRVCRHASHQHHDVVRANAHACVVSALLLMAVMEVAIASRSVVLLGVQSEQVN